MKALVLAVLAVVLVHRIISHGPGKSEPLMVGEGRDWFRYHRDGGGV